MLYGISALTAIFGVGAWVFGRVVESRSAACDSGSNRIGAGEAAYVAAVAHQNDVRLDRDVCARRAVRSSLWIAPSPGAPCDACGEAISVGHTEYQIVTGEREMRLDRRCYQRQPITIPAAVVGMTGTL